MPAGIGREKDKQPFISREKPNSSLKQKAAHELIDLGRSMES
jgi:hypothetical protein